MTDFQDKRMLAALAGGIVIVIIIAAVFLLQGGSVEVLDAKARATPAVIGVFVTIKNGTGSEVCLIGAELREQVNGNVKVDIHATSEEQGLYKMYPVEEVCIPPGETLEMRSGPGSYHIMIAGDAEALSQIKSDGIVQITLLLNNGERIEVDASIEG